MQFLFGFLLFCTLGLTRQPATCGDGKLYTWENQTYNDERFVSFPVIKGKKNGPAYIAGDKALDRMLREKLVLSDEARQNTFNLNYYCVVNCDGTIGEVVILGDPVVQEWTNLEHLLTKSTGWKAATLNGNPVNCIYFRTLLINGRTYH